MLIAASLIIIYPTLPAFVAHYFSFQYIFHIPNKRKIFIEAQANNLILLFVGGCLCHHQKLHRIVKCHYQKGSSAHNNRPIGFSIKRII
jgi:hypothetical protein